MIRPKGCKVIEGKVYVPLEDKHEVEEDPVGLPAPTLKGDVNVKFGHKVFVWRGNSSTTTIITAPEITTLPRGRLAERAIMKAVEAINKL